MFVVWLILAVVVVLAAVVLVRTLRFAPGAAPAVPQGEETIDRDKAVENLRTLIRCRTVSNTNHALEDDAEFEKLINTLPFGIGAVIKESCFSAVTPVSG